MAPMRMLPPRLRDRTVRPATWPSVLTPLISGMVPVVVTIMDRGDAVFGAADCIAASCDLRPPAKVPLSK
jgi:hypothetical protein